MKITSLLFAAGMFAILALTSCGKCQVCTQDSEPELRVCRGDYDNNTQYGLALDVYEAGGYDCK